MTKKERKEKIEKTVNWVNDIMRNKTVISLMLLIDGITFIISPKSGVNGLARGVAVTVIIAAATVLFGAFSQKDKTLKTALTIGAALAAILLSIATYIWPAVPSAILIYVLALAIISNGVSNILQTLKLEKIIRIRHNAREKIASVEQEIKSRLPENELSHSVEQGVTEQFSKRFDPVMKITGRFGIHSAAAMITDILSIAVGVSILLFRNRAGSELMRLCGIAMLIASATDLWLTTRVWMFKRKHAKQAQD